MLITKLKKLTKKLMKREKTRIQGEKLGFQQISLRGSPLCSVSPLRPVVGNPTVEMTSSIPVCNTQNTAITTNKGRRVMEIF